ncbi:MAG: glycosyltransferase 87 family protein, partial [Candidatus Limnocylindrales bacterium]
LRAGDQFAAGAPVYLDRLLDAIPADRSHYPFLYPPLLLPPLVLLAGVARPLVEMAWIGGSVAAVGFAMRRFGLPWRWALPVLLWRPVLEGIYVGNVAVPLLACLAVAVRHPAALVIPPVFKVYSGTATLWLIRERRWRSLLLGGLVVAVAALVTAGATGLGAWRDWLRGLDWFARSQPVLRDYLYGIALPRYLGALPALAVGLAVLLLALRARGTEGLARLGLATPALSPSVFVHGFLVAIPAMLALRPAVLWLAVAAMSFGSNAAYWLGPGLAVAGWLIPELRRNCRRSWKKEGVPDPLGGSAGPWPGEKARLRSGGIARD